MGYGILKNEIINDQKKMGFIGKTADEISEMLSTVGLSGEKIDAPIINADEVFAALDMVEWAIATQEQKDYIDKVLLMGELTPIRSIINLRITISSIYGDLPTTKAALLDATYKSASRAEVLGLGEPKRWDIERAMDGTPGFNLVNSRWVWEGV